MGRAIDNVFAGQGVVGVGLGGQGTDNAVVGRSIWGGRGHAVQWAVLLGGGQWCLLCLACKGSGH